MTPWPVGSGEMAERIRTHNWAATPLGPIETWPQSLRTAVDICLRSAFASFVLWGRDLIQLYNDAALTIVRAKHPGAFGVSVRDTWSEIWETIGPLIGSVLSTGQPMLGENLPMLPERGGPREPAYFTLCYSALPDEAGSVAGVLVTAIETTEKVRTEAALRESEEHYRSLVQASDTGYSVIEMKIEPDQPLDYRFIEVNHAFERLTGLTDVKGKGVRDLIPGLEEGWFETYRDVVLTGRAIHFERHAKELGNRWFSVYAFRLGAPERRQVGVLFTDITERKRAEQALWESEARFQQFAEHSTDVLWIADREKVEYVSPAYERIWGSPRDSLRDVSQWVETIHPEDRQRALDASKRSKTGEEVVLEYRIVRPDGTMRRIRETLFPIQDDQGEVQRAGRRHCCGHHKGQRGPHLCGRCRRGLAQGPLAGAEGGWL
jgi:PAS domain S-box-containing protein